MKASYGYTLLILGIIIFSLALIINSVKIHTAFNGERFLSVRFNTIIKDRYKAFTCALKLPIYCYTLDAAENSTILRGGKP